VQQTTHRLIFAAERDSSLSELARLERNRGIKRAISTTGVRQQRQAYSKTRAFNCSVLVTMHWAALCCLPNARQILSQRFFTVV